MQPTCASPVHVCPAGALVCGTAGRSLAAAITSTTAGADGAGGVCVANPEHPLEAERPELGACKACDAPANTTCVECWPLFSLNDGGECVRVRPQEGHEQLLRVAVPAVRCQGGTAPTGAQAWAAAAGAYGKVIRPATSAQPSVPRLLPRRALSCCPFKPIAVQHVVLPGVPTR